MIQNDRLRSYLAAASIVLYSFACVSSQIASDAEHPASLRAAQAPLPPVGAALSETDEPGPATNSPDAHSHAGGSAQEMTHGTPPSPDPHASQANPSGSAPTSNTGNHAGHGSPASPTRASDKADRWTCPMHPEVIQSEPGKCPKCGMKLVPATPKP